MEEQSSDAKFTSLLAMLPQEMIPSRMYSRCLAHTYDAKNTLQSLASAQLSCPPADDRLLEMYLEKMAQEGC